MHTENEEEKYTAVLAIKNSYIYYKQERLHAYLAWNSLEIIIWGIELYILKNCENHNIYHDL